MRLHLLLPKVDPKAILVPSTCGYADCESLQVQLHQPVSKALRDTVHHQVQVHRYRCLKCKRTFRVYPVGVTPAQSSDRVKGLAVMLYLLGLSYGAVSLALDSLGVPLSKTQVYETVQAAAARIPDLKRDQVFQGLKTKAVGGDLTSVKCAGHWLHLGLSVDALTGLVLTIDELAARMPKHCRRGLSPLPRVEEPKCSSPMMPMGSRRSPTKQDCCIKCAKAMSSAIPRTSLRRCVHWWRLTWTARSKPLGWNRPKLWPIWIDSAN